ncbi:hypothetical protein EK21DRAFT_88747 [Setomelanomma holmii]|uniref:Knr4/Smi1-like domain-containing protein n=1 Tax=Setomelanomma holmii TaxID=210430 RepID=A0A9P4HBF6_9PLEO|nr:hypothetical protein EK21DRAFT_88747 [Setomelanomma holmii]
MPSKADQEIIAAHEPQPEKPLFSRTDVLRSPNEDLYSKISNLAIQFAVLGYTDTAANLISKLNKHNWYHGQRAVIRSLHVLWDQIGRWPDGELDRVRQSIQDERKRAAEKKVTNDDGEETGKKVKLEVDDSPITEEDMKKNVDDLYHSYAQCWWYPERTHLWFYGGEDVPPSPHDQKVDLSDEEILHRISDLISAVHGFEEPNKYPDAVKGKETIEPASALVSALELRTKLEEDNAAADGTPSAQEILEMIAKPLDGRSQISVLTESRRAWPMLRDGALLRILGIKKEKVDRLAVELEEAVTERFEKGRQSFPDMSINELVQLINTNTLTNPDSTESFYERNIEVPSTILHDPASASLIEETEKGLATTLPDDYKEYLSITNGNDPAFGGIIMEAPLWKCEDIRWFKDDEDYFYDLCIDIPANMSSITHQTANDGLDWPKIGKGIILGQEDIDNTFLIAPDTVERVKEKVRSLLESQDEKVTQEVKDSVKRAVENFAGSMEEFNKLDWCCLTWASGGAVQMDGYKSFKAYLSYVAEKSAKVEKDIWNLGYKEFFGHTLVEELK